MTTLKLLKRALVWMTCLLWKETPRMPPEWKKSIKFPSLSKQTIIQSKDLILDINPLQCFLYTYYLWFHFLYLVKIHTLGCVVSVYVSEKKEKYTQVNSKPKKKKKPPKEIQNQKKKKKKKKS